MRWTHFTLPVSDLDASVRFFTDACGLRVVRDCRNDGGTTVWLGPQPAEGLDPEFVLVAFQGAIKEPLDHFGFQCETRRDSIGAHTMQGATVTTVARDVAGYERWLRKQCDVAEPDLKTKHKRMRKSAFDFLRATYFRWAKTIEATCPELVDAPRTLCVGDMHVENFGTWRDGRARLVWGVNDFDEAAPMPYAYDLVRLLTSARLAPTLAVNRREAAVALLEGYQKGLEQPRPMLLDEHEHWLRRLVGGAANASQKFWKEVDGYPDAKPPAPVRRALKRSLPNGARIERYASRVMGSGSLGRPRYLLIALWQGGRLVQEAKALVPSAWHWAHPDSPAKSGVLDLAFGPHRSPDPHLRVKAGYVLRRIAADAHKIELADVSAQGLREELLAAMGSELGAIHAARHRTSILKDLHKRDARWLDRAAAAAEKTVRRDFRSIGKTPVRKQSWAS